MNAIKPLDQISRLQLKKVYRWSANDKKLRLLRVMWNHGIVGDGQGYSTSFSIALMPKLFHWSRGFYRWRLTLLGIAFHWHRSYGGRFV